jgi:hypothetical protein
MAPNDSARPKDGAPALFLEAAVMRRGAAILVLLVLAALGCTESNQNRVIVRVSEINQGGPMFADVLAMDPQDSTFFVPTELVPVEFTSRPYSNAIVDPGNFSLDFHVQRYSVTWRATAATPPGINLAAFNHVEATSFIVPFNETAEMAILVVPLGMKTQSPFVDLVFNGQEIPLIADIEFIGAPAVEPEDEIRIQVSLSVNFADFADEE